MQEKEFKIKFEGISQTTHTFTLLLFPTTSNTKDMSNGNFKILSTAFVLNCVVTYFIGLVDGKMSAIFEACNSI